MGIICIRKTECQWALTHNVDDVGKRTFVRLEYISNISILKHNLGQSLMFLKKEHTGRGSEAAKDF